MESGIHNLDPLHERALSEAFSRHIGDVMAAQNMLDEKQIFECFVQALLSGDFFKAVVASPGSGQQFIYQPYRVAEELRLKYNELIYAVASKFPDETRHETALRYIREREELRSGAERDVEKD